jgi:hypothetical protein
MITPWMKKVSAVALVITLFVVGSAFLFATNSKHSKVSKPPVFKATFKGSARPMPIYGANSINTWGPSWTDKAFRDSAASTDVQIVRYPGGGFGDYWDWRKGWYIDSTEGKSKGMDLPQNFKQMKYSPTGLKELKLLVDQTHCDVLFELNMITRDLDDQIEMLKTAQSMGFPIKWIELGNEFNLVKSIGRTKFQGPRDYGTTCYNWTQKLKETFPGVEVGVIGGNKPYASEMKNWNSDVLNAASNVDAIVGHFYPLPGNILKDDGVDFESVYRSVRKEFDDDGFNDIKHKKIWITEYNILWAYVKPGPEGKAMQQYAWTWAQVLSTILMTSESTDLPGNPPMIIAHGLANWRGFASAEKRNGKVYMLPTGIGLRTWCQACHNKTSLRQISFKRGGDEAQDYEVLGWQFKGGGEETNLIVNFTSSPIQIDLSALGSTGKTHYDLKFADKNKQLSTWEDVSHEKKEINGNEIELPPYSIATL